MKMLVAMLITLFAPTTVLAQSSVNKGAVTTSEARIRQLEEEYARAREHGDSAALSRMVVPDFVSVASTGHVENRAYLLAHAGVTPSGERITKMVIDSVDVHVLDATTAVVIGHRGLVTASGTGGLRFLHVVAKRNGRWQLVAASVTSINVEPK